jgi:hypothetical protein
MSAVWIALSAAVRVRRRVIGERALHSCPNVRIAEGGSAGQTRLQCLDPGNQSQDLCAITSHHLDRHLSVPGSNFCAALIFCWPRKGQELNGSAFSIVFLVFTLDGICSCEARGALTIPFVPWQEFVLILQFGPMTEVNG